MSRPFSPAAERNKEPIFKVLNPLLPLHARVLEVGAGTGQHAHYLTEQRPDINWLATDVCSRVGELDAVARSTGIPPRFQVEALDIGRDELPKGPFDAVFTANTLHIMPWPNTARLMEGAGGRLTLGGILICYGPFKERGRHNSDSNIEFDKRLRARDPTMGIRDLIELRRMGAQFSLPAIAEISLPANNRLIVFKKHGATDHPSDLTP